MATSITGHDDARPNAAAWDERPIVGSVQGLPWWGAVLLGVGLSLFSAVVDLQLNDELTRLFQGGYFVACVAAVCLVRRRNLFAPIVQPPLIFTAVMPATVVYSDGLPDDFGMRDLVLSYGLPVINGFPAMAITTGVTLLIGIARVYLQRKPEDDDSVPANDARRGDDLDTAEPARTARRARPQTERRHTTPPRTRGAAQMRPPVPPPGFGEHPRPADNRARPLDRDMPPPGGRGRRQRVERPWEGPDADPPPPGRRTPNPPPRRQPPGAQQPLQRAPEPPPRPGGPPPRRSPGRRQPPAPPSGR